MSDALFNDLPEVTPPGSSAYRVLARKYRPTTFADMVGQEALVKTLSNAFSTGRIAHAFMMTGVRGVGKTTTARIIAKGLNCVEGPTITPCGKCDACVSITEGRNVDVIEIDAASHTGVDDIRQILDNVKYAPVSVKTKVYIIDEVHMLSKSAFNALLKTLEEPPPHVKFILATTEIRKVPVTILSRCQRYDLRRIEPEKLEGHFANVAKLENIEFEPEALQLLARAADGSARDGLSLMDQAIARGGNHVTADMVRDMLGLADRALVLDLLRHTLQGKAPEALELLATLHRDGVDALVLLQDLLDTTHQLSLIKSAPNRKGVDLGRGEGELASTLSIPVLARVWQVLLKGIAEVQFAPRPMAALEMLLIRLMHMGSLPTPGDLVKQLSENGAAAALAAGAPAGPPSGAPVMRAAVGMSHNVTTAMAQPATQAMAQPGNWQAVVALFNEKREMQLAAQLYAMVECVSFSQGHLELHLRPGVSVSILPRIAEKLQLWTSARWMVSEAKKSAVKTLSEEADAVKQGKLDKAAEHPVVKAVLLAFPQAKIDTLREKAIAEAPADDTTPDSGIGFDDSIPPREEEELF